MPFFKSGEQEGTGLTQRLVTVGGDIRKGYRRVNVVEILSTHV
jgi:hypothetical protein